MKIDKEALEVAQTVFDQNRMLPTVKCLEKAITAYLGAAEIDKSSKGSSDAS